MHCPRRRPQNRARGAVPRTGTHKSEMCFGFGLRCPACPGSPGWGFFLGLGSLVPFPGPCVFLSFFPFSFCFFSLTAGVTFQLPEGGTSGQSLGRRPKNRHWAHRLLGEILYFVALALVFPFLFATLFSRVCVSSLQDARWALGT